MNVEECSVTEEGVRKAAEDKLKINVLLRCYSWKGDNSQMHSNWVERVARFYLQHLVILSSSLSNNCACAACFLFKAPCCLHCFSRTESVLQIISGIDALLTVCCCC